MKYLKIIDFVGQTFVWLILVAGGTLILFSNSKGDFWLLALACQFGIGCWQMLSCLIILLTPRAEQVQLRKSYFLIALSDLFLLGVLTALGFLDRSGIGAGIVIAVGVVIPWCLAIFYYFITWRGMFPKRYSGKFLSHINL